jgi:hypothetical protein
MEVGKDGMWVEVLFDTYDLNLQCLFCKATMVMNSESVLNKNLVI